MIYKFKSKAAGDLIFLPENARQILSILGKNDAAQGIIEPAHMAAAVLALQAAVAQAEQAQVAIAQAKIDKIIATIDDGTYGYCVDTGEEIGIKRLEGRPMAERTVDAQERWEHKKKQLGD